MPGESFLSTRETAAKQKLTHGQGSFLLKIFGLLWALVWGAQKPHTFNAWRGRAPLSFQHLSSTVRRMRGPMASFALLWFQGQLELQKTLSLKRKSLQTKPKRKEDSPVSMCRGFITEGWKGDSTLSPGAAGERWLLLPLFYIEKLRGREGNCLVQAI